MKTFEELLGKDSPLLKSITERGFTEPSEIQEKSIPEILKGKDMIAGASTGSGKTLAFAAGLINNVKMGLGIQGIVLTPTRELAEQITKELTSFSKPLKLKVISIYGGVSINNQMRDIRKADIVVATPGRMLDHMQRGSINLDKINTLVLDEADRMLDMGFINDVEKIIGECPDKKQTMLFSATISGVIDHLSKKYLNNPVEVTAKPHVDASKLTQVYYDVQDGLKYSLLLHLLEKESSGLVMIFCNTRRNVDFVANNLKKMHIEAIGIHGGFTQDKRTRILKEFHSNKVHVLVATDVAARGLDIKGISHVYNYDIPKTKDDYTHRIGRTARAGKEGKVINLITSRDYENFDCVNRDKEFNIKLEKTPFIRKAEILWKEESRGGFNRGGSGGSRGGFNRGGSGGSRGGFSRGGSGGSRGGFSRDNRSSDSKPRSGGFSRGGDSRPRSGGFSRDSKPRSGGFSRDSKPRSGGFSRDNRSSDSKPRSGGFSRDRDSKPSYGKKKTFGSKPRGKTYSKKR